MELQYVCLFKWFMEGLKGGGHLWGEEKKNALTTSLDLFLKIRNLSFPDYFYSKYSNMKSFKRFVLPVCFMWIAGLAKAQTPHFNHTTIFVVDMNKSADFY